MTDQTGVYIYLFKKIVFILFLKTKGAVVNLLITGRDRTTSAVPTNNNNTVVYSRWKPQAQLNVTVNFMRGWTNNIRGKVFKARLNWNIDVG